MLSNSLCSFFAVIHSPSVQLLLFSLIATPIFTCSAFAQVSLVTHQSLSIESVSIPFVLLSSAFLAYFPLVLCACCDDIPCALQILSAAAFCL